MKATFYHRYTFPLVVCNPFAQLGQDTAQAVGGHPSHDRRMGGLHTFKQLGGGEAKHFLRIVLFCSKAKAKAEQPLLRVHACRIGHYVAV